MDAPNRASEAGCLLLMSFVLLFKCGMLWQHQPIARGQTPLLWLTCHHDTIALIQITMLQTGALSDSILASIHSYRLHLGLILEGVKVEDLLADDERQGDGNMFGKSKGKEIEEIPLCAQCVEDVGIGSSDDEHLIPLALDRIEGFDGGLSRRRWEARHKDQRTTAAGHCNSPQRVAGNIRRTPSPIYVSSHDPLGEPAFRASAAKPIPKWMQYLPSYRRSEQARFEHPASVFDSLLSKPNLKSVSLDTDEQDSLPPPVPPHIVPVRPNALNYSPPLTPAQKSRPFTLIAEEPVQRPSYTRFGAGQAKHVRFGSNSRGSLSPISLLRNTAQSPSESAEYLDEYNVSIPRNVRSSAAPIRSPPGEANEHHARVLSPFLRRVDNHPLLSNASLDSSRKSADEIDDEERLPFSTLPQHSAAEAISATQKQALGHTRSHSHADKGSGDPVNYVKSSSSNWRAGADGPGENSRRRPPTFQDQLKRVFGFY
ncbi:hypothetical protein M406DRAFT_325298 [Cryphonectria parasitica EP155]|uniref:Uncharacterized protein n=1 Tax=Cryphonectria parasitica (strain ATCC 38755 / EP155) TaxID=660469 RepID=A0A9P4YBV3_CRYP1|nr:uncharacterized protein M406DRAFT_325298 [Cryphonectria parasitica EP155]KAF3769815.1 hypothetical protein M406DRAFT_325298 [Cryphonectria parasitica EP155]